MLTKLTISHLPINWGSDNSEYRQNQTQQESKVYKGFIIIKIIINKIMCKYFTLNSRTEYQITQGFINLKINMKLLKYYINQRIATDNSTVQFKCLSKQLVQYLTQITPKYFQIQDLSKTTAT